MGMYDDIEAGKSVIQKLKEAKKKSDEEKMQKQMEKAKNANDNAAEKVEYGNSFLHRHFPKYFP